MGSPLDRLTAVALVVVALPAGLWLMRLVARRMGDHRRARLADVNRISSALATTAGGAFEPGTTLAYHPLLGELRRYGTAHVAAGRLAIEVGVRYRGRCRRRSDHSADCSAAEWRWRVTRLRLRHPWSRRTIRAPSTARSPAASESPVPPSFRPRRARRWYASGRGLLAANLREGTLELVAAPDGETTYVSPVARLHTLVEQVAEAAEALLLPGGADAGGRLAAGCARALASASMNS